MNQEEKKGTCESCGSPQKETKDGVCLQCFHRLSDSPKVPEILEEVNDDSTQSTGPWRKYVDPTTNLEYYINVETMESSWETPQQENKSAYDSPFGLHTDKEFVKNVRHDYAIETIVKSEEEYCRALWDLTNLYQKPLLENPGKCGISEKEVVTLFGNIDQIVDFHMKFFTELKKRQQSIGSLYSKTYLKELYTPYVENYSIAKNLLSGLQEYNETFGDFLDEVDCEQAVESDLSSMLLMPIFRISEYGNLFRILSGCTDEDTTEANLINNFITHISNITDTIGDETKTRPIAPGLPDFQEMDFGDLQEFCRLNCVDVADVPRRWSKRRKTNAIRRKLRAFLPINDIYHGPGYSSFVLRSKLEQYQKYCHCISYQAQKFADSLTDLPQKLTKTELMLQKEEELPSLLEQLEETKCKILVFGDLKSGKSTLVNLLLQEPLMRSAAIPASSTVCEIHYSEEKKMFLNGKRLPEDINFEDMSPEHAYHTIAEFIATERHGEIAHDGGQFDPNRIYRRVIVKWPIQLLKPGIVLVDSPGLNESSNLLDPIVKEYLPKSNGTICVIDATKSITQSLREFLAIVQKHQQQFDPNSIFFIISKIDRIPPRERTSVLLLIKQQLRSLIQPINPNHVFAINLLAAQKVQSSQLQSPEYVALLAALVKYLTASFKLKLRVLHYKLKDAVKTFEKALNIATSAQQQNPVERRKMGEGIQETLDSLTEKQKLLGNRVSRLARDHQLDLVLAIRTHILNQKSKIVFTTQDYVHPSDQKLIEVYPEISSHPDRLNKWILDKVVIAICNEISEMEAHQQKALKARQDFVKEVCRLFAELSIQIQDIDGMLSGVKVSQDAQIDEESKAFNVARKAAHMFGGDGDDDGSGFSSYVLAVAAIPGYIVLGAAALVFGIIGAFPYGLYRVWNTRRKIKEKENIKENFSAYCADIAEHVIVEFVDISNGPRSNLDKLVSSNFLDVQSMANTLLDNLEQNIKHYRDIAQRLVDAPLVPTNPKFIEKIEGPRRILTGISDELSNIEIIL